MCVYKAKQDRTLRSNVPVEEQGLLTLPTALLGTLTSEGLISCVGSHSQQGTG
jgi:hypothetical protein